METTALRLLVKDLATEELAQGCPNLGQGIVISSQLLCRFLQITEARQPFQEEHAGSTNKLRQEALKRRRSETPPDNVRPDDEAKFQAAEKRVEKRGCCNNLDYRPNSSSTGCSI